MEGGDPGRTSRSEFAVAATLGMGRMVRLNRFAKHNAEEYATPIVIGKTAYVGHSGKSFDAVDVAGDRVVWSVPTAGRVFTTAAYADGLLFFGDDEGAFRAVRLDGTEVWTFQTEYPLVASPLAVDGRVFLLVSDNNLFALEASTGRPLWQYGREFPHRNSLWRSGGLCYGGGRLVAGFSDGTVVSLEPELGRVVWRAEIGGSGLFADVMGGPVYADGRIYAGVFRGPLVSLDAQTGVEMWRQALEVASGIAVGDRLLYLGSSDGSVRAVRREDGAPVWQVPLDGGAPTSPVLAANALLVGASEGSLLSLDPATGDVLGRYTPGPGIHAQPLVARGVVVFLSDGGVLHALY